MSPELPLPYLQAAVELDLWVFQLYWLHRHSPGPTWQDLPPSQAHVYGQPGREMQQYIGKGDQTQLAAKAQQVQAGPAQGAYEQGGDQQAHRPQAEAPFDGADGIYGVQPTIDHPAGGQNAKQIDNPGRDAARTRDCRGGRQFFAS